MSKKTEEEAQEEKKFTVRESGTPGNVQYIVKNAKGEEKMIPGYLFDVLDFLLGIR
jgi:hypothetical protein